MLLFSFIFGTQKEILSNIYNKSKRGLELTRKLNERTITVVHTTYVLYSKSSEAEQYILEID